ncbi:hypothetical protein C0J29_11730 [Mycobacterium paragordonae]|uniref:Uncharacterized protein n=1 Tax=Mycobacterium paragordonae TaxID=1389713 RepID=A0ABQ1C2A1_9MYCO|nr:hypothetical protein [Mycobacterium paragordonae]AYE95360.1 hypothetical protein C0J29_11730 [Mycobacterium paragordonae]GFG78561.1 hypothetical protein MPRG_18370 [Mycobacterium paragordonae]
MTDATDAGPPEKEVSPSASQCTGADHQVSHDTITTATQSKRFDALSGSRKRREAAVRLMGGDPAYPGELRCHQPSTGLRALGFREGFQRGANDALRRVWCQLPPEMRGTVERLAAEYKVAVDD